MENSPIIEKWDPNTPRDELRGMTPPEAVVYLAEAMQNAKEVPGESEHVSTSANVVDRQLSLADQELHAIMRAHVRAVRSSRNTRQTK